MKNPHFQTQKIKNIKSNITDFKEDIAKIKTSQSSMMKNNVNKEDLIFN